MSSLTLVKKIAVTALLDHCSHDVLVSSQVINGHEFEICDGIVLSIQNESWNCNIGNECIAGVFPIQHMTTFVPAHAPSHLSVELQ